VVKNFHFRRTSITEAVPTDNWQTPLGLHLLHAHRFNDQLPRCSPDNKGCCVEAGIFTGGMPFLSSNPTASKHSLQNVCCM